MQQPTRHDVELTSDGIRMLRREVNEEPYITLQVLGIYRYLIDPSLRDLLRLPSDHAVRDVFDLLLSDGQFKVDNLVLWKTTDGCLYEQMKCILAPALNELVWKGQIVPLDAIHVSKYDVMSDQTHHITLLQRIHVHPTRIHERIVYANDSQEFTNAALDVQFIGKHPRELQAMPLAGERLLYLSLHSDSFAIDWLHEAHREWLMLLQNSDLQALQSTVHSDSLASSGIEWHVERSICRNLFPPGVRTLRSIAQLKQSSLTKQSSRHPILGVVQFKSTLQHIGEPNVSNPLPLMFHVVVADQSDYVEVAFFGSMGARYFRTIQEGDMVQLSGYSIAISQHIEGAIEIYFPHESTTASVCHVPESFWTFLNAADIVHIQRRNLTDIVSDVQGPTLRNSEDVGSFWLACRFLTTLDVQYWDEEAVRSSKQTMYFDFIGVVSYAGKVERLRRHRKHFPINESLSPSTRADTSSEFEEIRWIKVIDRNSSTEMIVKLGISSQPEAFYTMRAGDVVMLTKLQWITKRSSSSPLSSTGAESPRSVANGASSTIKFEYAETTRFTRIRVNESTEPYRCTEEGMLNNYFAKNIQSNCRRTQREHGATTLRGESIAGYQPRHQLLVDAKEWAAVLDIPVLRVSQLPQVIESLTVLEERRLAVIGTLESTLKASTNQLFLELHHQSKSQRPPLRLRVEPTVMFQRHKIPQQLLEWAKSDKDQQVATSLLAILPPVVLKNLAALPKPRSSAVSSLVQAVETMLTAKHQTWCFSIRCYRDAHGSIELVVDAILT